MVAKKRREKLKQRSEGGRGGNKTDGRKVNCTSADQMEGGLGINSLGQDITAEEPEASEESDSPPPPRRKM